MSAAEQMDAPATAARDSDVRAEEAQRGEKSVTAAVVTIAKPARELYDCWRGFANLAQVMENVDAITVDGPDRSTWSVKGPGGRIISWESIVTEDRPGESIAWQ